MYTVSTSIVACYNYTGTPYVKKQVLPEVVYAYGLNESIAHGYLKDADPIGFENVKNEEFLRTSITKFWERYGGKTYEGLLPKLAIFAANVKEATDVVRPAVEKVLSELGISLSTVLVNTGDPSVTKDEDIKNFNNLDVIGTEGSKKQFIILVEKGREGWNCRSLLGIALFRKANYIAVRGKGNPNEEGGEYKTAISVLYAVAYTLKMSYKTDYKIEGFFEYVVPPLEGFWWQDNVESVDYTNKSAFNWISVIRLPDFITKKDFDWAVETASKKKKMDCSGAEFLSIDEGLCVQIMHIGAFDDEPATVAMMDKYLEENGYVNDFTDERRHHEIYLSDPRKVAPEKCKTVIRHPIKKA